jgi:8-amino-7-oxononanoate synthase
MRDLAADLERRARAHLYRTRRVVDGPQGPEPVVDGRRVVAFCSNDYLGLAGDPRVAEALAYGARAYGAGSGAAHLVIGHNAPHHALEEELAEFVGRPRALLFSTGYMANLGAIGALVGRGDSVLEDRLNHASLIDGATLSRARLRRYAHRDAEALGRQLAEAKGEVLVATDGVFSMDGDLAPLPELAAACRVRGAWLMVDDAHGLGVIGPGGRGTAAQFGLGPDEVPVLVGTLGKAFGTAGAFVAGSAELVDTLMQHARSYVYTTAPPPAVAQATRTALRIALAEEWRRERLVALVTRFRREARALGLPLMDSPTPIQPILLGSAARSLQWAEALERAGVLVTPIRPPTVPEGESRLRVTFSARHTDAHLDRLLEALHGLQRREEAA